MLVHSSQWNFIDWMLREKLMKSKVFAFVSMCQIVIIFFSPLLIRHHHPTLLNEFFTCWIDEKKKKVSFEGKILSRKKINSLTRSWVSEKLLYPVKVLFYLNNITTLYSFILRLILSAFICTHMLLAATDLWWWKRWNESTISRYKTA